LHSSSSSPPRWITYAVKGLNVALLAATITVLFSDLPTTLIALFLSTLVIIRLAVAGVFGAYAGRFPLYNVPMLLQSPRCAVILMLIFVAYLTLLLLMAINGLAWDGIAAKICGGFVVVGDLYLTFSDAIHTSRRKGTAERDPLLAE
jgi:membrane associated rhomboid family serine protease